METLKERKEVIKTREEITVKKNFYFIFYMYLKPKIKMDGLFSWSS